MLLFMFFLFFMLLTSSMSPMKISFFLVMMSLWFSGILYSNFLSVFPCSAMIISFSSGMMILFCYCCILSSYETKNIYYSKFLYFFTLFILLTPFNLSLNTLFKKDISMILSSPLLIFGVSVIFLALICINKSLYSPFKSFIISY